MGWKSCSLAMLLALSLAACSCDREEKADPATLPEAVAAADQPSPLPEPHSLLADFPHCTILHRGLSLDLGEPATEVWRNFEVGPFEDVEYIERGGASFSRIKQRRIRYAFWLDQELPEVIVRARVHGGRSGSMAAYIDGKRVGGARLSSGNTKIAAMGRRELSLKPGRHRLALHFSRGDRGSELPYAEIDWVRIQPPEDDERAPTYAAPTLRNILVDVVLERQPRQSLALRAPSAVRCPIRPSRDARLKTYLGFWGNGRGKAQVRVLSDGEEPVTLEERSVVGGPDAGWSPLELDLRAYAGELVVLEFRSVEATSGGRVVFGAPVIQHQAETRTVPETDLVILLVGAGLNRRRLPPWGKTGELTGLGRLVREGVAFSNYRAPTSVPAGVLASLLTGLPPRAHAVEDQAARLPKPIVTLSELLKQAGGRAAMFTGAPTSFAAFGFDAGWDTFEELSPVNDLPASEPLTRLTRWIEEEFDSGEPKKRLAVAHLRGAHPPWDLTKVEASSLKPEEYGGSLDPRRGGITLGKLRRHRRRSDRRMPHEDWVRLQELELAALAKQDQALNRLIQSLIKRELWSRTLLVFMGDVGSGDPPEPPYHPAGPLDEDRLMAPLLVKFPGEKLSGSESHSPVTSTDVAHTLTRALGLKLPRAIPFVDLFEAASGLEPVVAPVHYATLGNQYASRLGHWLLRGSLGETPTLCDLSVDPACVNDVFDTRPRMGRALWRFTYLSETRGRHELRVSPREPASIDPNTAAALTVWGDIP